MKKILVIKLGALGDFVLMTGLMQSIRRAYPDAHITLMTNQSFIKLARQSGYFDDFIVDNRTHKVKDYIRIIRQLASNRFDLIFDLQISKRTRRLYYWATRIFAKRNFTWAKLTSGGFCFINIVKKYPLTWGRTTQQTQKWTSFPPTLTFCRGDNTHFDLLPDRYVLLIPGCSANHPYKRWPATSYAELAHKLAEKNIPTVVLGTSTEREEINVICSREPMAVDFCNKSSLMDIPNLAQKALAVVGNDTGPTHMASLVDKPVVALFCEKTQRSALSLPNVHNIIKQNIADITPDEVLVQLQKMMPLEG